MPPIIAAEEFHAKPDIADMDADFGPHTWSWVWHSAHFDATGTIPHKSEVDRSFSVSTFVNHGRWSVLCPWCPASEYASRTVHRFLCSNCGNASNGGKWIRVIWPEKWELIERILELRPDPAFQHWNLNEPIDNLIQENEQAGIPTRSRVGL